MSRRLRSRNVTLGVSFTAMAAMIGTTTGCAEAWTDEPEKPVPTYCVNAQEHVVDSELCDGDEDDSHDHDSHGVLIPYYIMYGHTYPHNLPIGAKVPAGGTKISHTDTAARTAAGIPARGGFGNTAAKVSSNGGAGG